MKKALLSLLLATNLAITGFLFVRTAPLNVPQEFGFVGEVAPWRWDGTKSLLHTFSRAVQTLVSGYGSTATTTNAALEVQGDIHATGSVSFLNEIQPDGATCSNGNLLQKTGTNDWDCVAASSIGSASDWLSTFSETALTPSTTNRGLYVPTASSTLGQFRFNDDLTNVSIGWGRTSAQLQFKDASSTDILRLYPSNDSISSGLYSSGHFHLGKGTSFITNRPQTYYLMSIAEDTADTWNATDLTGGFSTGLLIQPQLNADIAQVVQQYFLADYTYRLNAGFDSTDGAGGGLATQLVGARHQILSSMTAPLVGSISNVELANFNVNFSLNNTPTAVTTLYGIRVQNLSITNPVPARSYGISLPSLNGTLSWGINAGSNIQMNTQSRFYLGGSALANGLNWISRGPSATEIIMGVNNANEYSFFNSSFGPYSAGGSTAKTLGQATTLGWSGLYLQDTAASFTVFFRTTNTSISANRTFTYNGGNADRTLTLSGSPTLGDWFDQSVKIAATPTFAGVKVGASGLDVGTGSLPSTTWLVIAAPGAGFSQIQLTAGTAPSSPLAVDIWNDSSDSRFHFGSGLNVPNILNTGSGTTTISFTASTTLSIMDGHIHSGGDAPTASECGTTPTFATDSNDNAGKVTAGSGTATACKIAFRYTWNAAPSCIITGDLTSVLASTTSTGLNLYFGGSNGAGGVYMYQCKGLRR